MTSLRPALRRTSGRLAAVVATAALLAACSGASPSIANPTTTPSEAPAVAATTATATPAGSPTPAPAAQPAAWAALGPGPVAPGTYYIGDSSGTGVSRLTFTVPAGWTAADIVAKDPGTPGEVMFTTWVVTDVFPDACKWSESSIVDAGTTPEALMTALAAQKSRTASAVTDTTVAGYPAKQIVLTVAPTLRTSTCTDGNLRYWPGPGPDFHSGLCCNPSGNVDVVTGVNVNGKRMVIVARHYPGSSSQSLAELGSIVDSIQLQP